MIKTKDIKPRETTEDPFKKNVACEHLLMHRQLEELRDLIRTSISKQSLALISGPPGVGKTTAIRSVTDELPAHKYTVVYLGQDHNSANVLRRFALSLGIDRKSVV